MTHLLIPSIIGGLSLLIFTGLIVLDSRTDSFTTTSPIVNKIGSLLLFLFCSLSGSLLIFAALPEYSFIIHRSFKVTFIPHLAVIPYVILSIFLVYCDAQKDGTRVITTDILVLLCLAMLPVLLVGAIPYQPWMAPASALILAGDMIMTQAIKNEQKRLAQNT